MISCSSRVPFPLAHHRTRTKPPSSRPRQSPHSQPPSLAHTAHHQSNSQYTALRLTQYSSGQRLPNLSSPFVPLPCHAAHRCRIIRPLPADVAWPAASAPIRRRAPSQIAAALPASVGAAQVPRPRAGSASVSADLRWLWCVAVVNANALGCRRPPNCCA